MLAREGSSLYWSGRYIERSEHLSRYLKVQYFSTLDAPMIQKKELVLKSILFMTGLEPKDLDEGMQLPGEQEILVDVAFNPDNPNSIRSSVEGARENARSVRYIISSELWEVINRYYHFVNGYSVDFYKTRGLYEFTTQAVQHCAIIRSHVDSTLLHDDVWTFFKLGFFIERAAQIIRILSNKLHDIHYLNRNGQDDPLTTYQWTITLKALETYDMYRRLYRGITDQKKVITFLLTNPTLSRSVAFSLEQVKELLSHLSFTEPVKSSLEFRAAKLANAFKYLEYKDISDDLLGFLNESLNNTYELNSMIESKYFE